MTLEQHARRIIDLAQANAAQARDLQWQQHLYNQQVAAAQAQQQQAQAAQQHALNQLRERIEFAQSDYAAKRYHPTGDVRAQKVERLGRDLALTYGLKADENALVTMAADPALMMAAEDALAHCASRREELETAPQRMEEARIEAEKAERERPGWRPRWKTPAWSPSMTKEIDALTDELTAPWGAFPDRHTPDEGNSLVTDTDSFSNGEVAELVGEVASRTRDGRRALASLKR